GINESITYSSMTILFSTAGVVDTGTTCLLIATDALAKYQSATGTTSDKMPGLLTISSAKYTLTSLVYHFAQETYSLTPNTQIWPHSLNSYIHVRRGVIYLIVSDIGMTSGLGLDFINGTHSSIASTLYDTTKSMLFHQNSFTDATTN
ncbi:hypothetical protein BDR07DRAFT_1321933, partial [Suillus spraguei]